MIIVGKYEHLARLWRRLRDGADSASFGHVEGAIEALAATGAITEDEAELWTRRIRTCPGHDDEGGRDWCAYCGKMQKEVKR